MEILLLHLLAGLTLGATYALVAVGLSIVFGVVRLVNFAHGELYMLGSYLLVWLYVDHDIPYGLAVLLAMLGMAILGGVFERVVVRPVLSRTWRTQLIATIAASIVISNVAILIWGTYPKMAPTPLSIAVLRAGPVNISYQRLLILGITIGTFLLLSLFIAHTKMGKAMRAVSQNRDACTVYGIDVKQVSSVTFVIGSGLAALAGALITPLTSVYPSVGSAITLKALAAVVMGGFGQISGVIYAALILGFAESLFAGYVSFAYRDVAAFVIMILVLLLRPYGLFHRKVGL